MRKEVIGDCTLYLGDCMDVLPTLPMVDAVITDPPYGLGNKLNATGQSKHLWGTHFGEGAPEWDKTICQKEIEFAVEKSNLQIIWGGNYYLLPPARCWLIWDKMQEHTSGHAELAWTNLDKPIRTFRYSRVQLASEGKVHPTQKPLSLMIWCIEQIENARTILDPFMGSGTTGVACAHLNRKFVGIERESKYFDIACERVEHAYAQGQLFPSNEKINIKQEGLFHGNT